MGPVRATRVPEDGPLFCAIKGPREEISGFERQTTNNRMEMRAVIEALRMLKEPCKVKIHTDSRYLRDGITLWIHGWKHNGWITKGKLPVRTETSGRPWTILQ